MLISGFSYVSVTWHEVTRKNGAKANKCLKEDWHLYHCDTCMLASCPGQVDKEWSLKLKPCSCKRQARVMHSWIWWQHFSY